MYHTGSDTKVSGSHTHTQSHPRLISQGQYESGIRVTASQPRGRASVQPSTTFLPPPHAAPLCAQPTRLNHNRYISSILFRHADGYVTQTLDSSIAVRPDQLAALNWLSAEAVAVYQHRPHLQSAHSIAFQLRLTQLSTW